MPALHSRRLLLSSAALTATLLGACTTDSATSPLLPSAPPHRNVVSPYHVTSTADDGSDGTLRKELLDATDGSTVTIDPSLAGQKVTLALGALVVDKNVVILGPGAGGITIAANWLSQVFSVSAGSLKLVDATVTEGRGAQGGGIRASAPLTLERVRVIGNQATDYGGGIYTESGVAFTMIDGSISGNVAGVSGGGGNFYGPVTITSSTIDGNSTSVGSSNGGGISLHANGYFERVTISGNVSASNGGGLEIVGPAGSTSVTLSNSTVSGNVAEFEGGGIFVYGAVVVLRHSTIAFNRAVTEGGGIGTDANPALTFQASIVAKNTTAAGVDPNCAFLPSLALFGTSIVDDSSCGPGSVALLQADPKLGALASNGGPTKTHMLLIGSPAIDLEAACVVAIDQRGVARPQGVQCDAGAVEFDAYIVPALSIDPSGTVNQVTGVAVVSGKQGCSSSTPLTLRVTVTQQQKVRKVQTTVTGSTDITVNCDATQLWAAAIKPLTGSFNNSPAQVTVQTVTPPAWVKTASASASSVVMAWSRK